MVEGMAVRTKVLAIALDLEKNTNDLIKSFFKIEKTKLKGLTNKSGSLTFKNKIDILHDFDIIDSDEYDKFLLLMEIRNQFMHNHECNNFRKVLDVLGNKRDKKLLSFVSQAEKSTVQEDDFYTGYQNCYFEVSDIIVKIYYRVADNLNMKSNFFKTYILKWLEVYNEHLVILDQLNLDIAHWLNKKEVDILLQSEILEMLV